jgi:hypothetical protein
MQTFSVGEGLDSTLTPARTSGDVQPRNQVRGQWKENYSGEMSGRRETLLANATAFLLKAGQGDKITGAGNFL